MNKPIALIFFFSFFVMTGFAQRTSPIGKWKTVDDNTGKVKSTVEIYEKGGKLFGKVLELFDPEKPDPVCEECDESDPRHMKPFVGLEVILYGLRPVCILTEGAGLVLGSFRKNVPIKSP